jgi:hypothetical protein
VELFVVLFFPAGLTGTLDRIRKFFWIRIETDLLPENWSRVSVRIRLRIGIEGQDEEEGV